MQQQAVATWYLLLRELASVLDVLLCDCLAVIFKRGTDEPALFVLEELMDTVLEPLCAVVKAGVIDHKGTALIIHESGIMALSHTPLAILLEAPITIRTHNQVASIVAIRAKVQGIAVIGGCIPARIHKRPVGILRAEQTHHIASD